jgi:hypothetical protein
MSLCHLSVSASFSFYAALSLSLLSLSSIHLSIFLSSYLSIYLPIYLYIASPLCYCLYVCFSTSASSSLYMRTFRFK